MDPRATVVLLIGTKKGLFLARSDAARREWEFCGPRISGTWAVTCAAYDPSRGRIFAGAASNWYGAAVWWSDDRGETWEHSSAGMTLGRGEPGVEGVWSLLPAGDGGVYAGTDPAGLFRSGDGGKTWEPLPALREHPTRATWRRTNAGLPLHALLAAPAWPGGSGAPFPPLPGSPAPRARPGRGPRGAPGEPGTLWAAVGAGGVYRSADGGLSWERGGDAAGPCVHGVALAPGQPGRLYQQHHEGVFRSDDGGATWCDVSAGLPSRFGFPVAAHPREAGTLYVVPLDPAGERRAPPGGRLAAWRSRDAGGSWERLESGLPREPVHCGVWRGALATDTLDPAGVYLGTSNGQLYASADEGDSWTPVAPYLPPILCVTATVLE